MHVVRVRVLRGDGRHALHVGVWIVPVVVHARVVSMMHVWVVSMVHVRVVSVVHSVDVSVVHGVRVEVRAVPVRVRMLEIVRV